MLYTKLAISKVNLTPASGYKIEGECYRFGRIVICSISLAKTSGSVTATHGTTFITGFPNNIMDVRVDGQHWANGASTQPTAVRFTLNHGALQGFYNGANEIINNSQPVMINFVYITYPVA